MTISSTLALPGTDIIEVSDLQKMMRDDPATRILDVRTGGEFDGVHIAGAGKQRLHLLDGGLDAWISGGGDVVRGTSETWALDRQVRLVAGSISLLGILLSILLPKAKWIAGGVATGLTFSAVSNTCAMGNMLGKLPYNRGRGCDIESVLVELRAAA